MKGLYNVHRLERFIYWVLYRTSHKYTNSLQNISREGFLLQLCPFGQASYTGQCLMLSDLWQQVRLMIKDSSEGLGDKPFASLVQWERSHGGGKEGEGMPF